MPSPLAPILAIYVRTEQCDPIDPPAVIGAWAIVRAETVIQGRLREIHEASSHAQGVLVVLRDVLAGLRPSATPIRLVVPDACVAEMLAGRTEPTTRRMSAILHRTRALLDAKLPNASVETGRFYDLVRAESFEDRWG